MNAIKIVMSKELSRVFKDKKMIFSLFILPVILMVGMFGLISTLATNAENDVEKHVSSVYIQNAPDVFKSMTSQLPLDSLDLIYINEDANLTEIKDNILKGDNELLVVFPDDFINNMSKKGQLPLVDMYYNPSEDYSQNAFSTFNASVMEAFRQSVLVSQYGSMDAVKVFDVTPNEIVDDAKATGKMLGMLLPYFITIMLFAGSMSLGVDTIAGEKERGTIASLLMTPAKRTSIVMGKLVSLMILSVISASVYVVTMVVAVPLVIKNMGLDLAGLSISFTAVQIIELIVIMIGLVFLYVALIGLVAVFAKTVKEASTYVMPLYIIVIVAGMLTMYGNAESNPYMFAIPLYNSSMALKAILTGDITGLQFALTAISTFVAAGLITFGIGKAFNSEKVMFNA